MKVTRSLQTSPKELASAITLYQKTNEDVERLRVHAREAGEKGFGELSG